MKIDLQKFALAPTEFNEGDSANGGQQWLIEVDLSTSGAVGTNYEVLCYTSSAENFGDNVTTRTDSCSNGVTGGAIVSQEYTIDYEATLIKVAVSDELYQLGLNYKNRNNVPIRVTNTLAGTDGVVKQFAGYISIDTADYPTDDLGSISGTIGVYVGSSITEGVITGQTPEVPVQTTTV